jgi:outer membrane biosynthesis protein TonB
MSIEKSLERIADALEVITKRPVTEAPVDDKPAAKEKKKPAAKETKKPAEKKESSDGPTKDDVREALKGYQKRESPTAARELLQTHGNGAASITALDEDDYQAIIDACAE